MKLTANSLTYTIRRRIEEGKQTWVFFLIGYLLCFNGFWTKSEFNFSLKLHVSPCLLSVVYGITETGISCKSAFGPSLKEIINVMLHTFHRVK